MPRSDHALKFLTRDFSAIVDNLPKERPQTRPFRAAVTRAIWSARS